MAHPPYTMHENFVYNSMLARALVHTFPIDDRTKIQAWLNRLHKGPRSGPAEHVSIRNDYMWFLLLVLQNGRLSIPFSGMPPQCELKQLQEVLPGNVYEDILTASVQNFAWMDKDTNEDDTPMRPASPSEFLEKQPMPEEGFFCYMAVFSNQLND